MALWDQTSKPKSILDVSEQTKTILTDEGWVRTITYTDRHGNTRTKSEVLVSGFTPEFASLPNGKLFLVDKDGNYMMHPDGSYLVG
jgi:hypothetical protein